MLLSDGLYAMYLMNLRNLWWPCVTNLLPLTYTEILAFTINRPATYIISSTFFIDAAKSGILVID